MNNWIILFNLFKLLYLPNEPQLSTTIIHTSHTHAQPTLEPVLCARTVGTFRGHLASSNQQQCERERHKNIIIIKNTIKCKKLLRMQQHQLCVLLEFAAYRRIEPLFRATQTRTRTSLGHLPLGQLVQFWLSTWAACLAIWLLLLTLLLLHIAAKRIGVWNFG